jgi:hypothetical protein
VAFVSRGKLKRVDLAGGNIQQLCDAPRLTGGTWNAQGVILFGPDYQRGVILAPQVGLEPTTLRLTACLLLSENKGLLFVLKSLHPISVTPIYPLLRHFVMWPC